MKRARHSMRFGVALFVAMLFWPAFASAQVYVECIGGLPAPPETRAFTDFQAAIDSLEKEGGIQTIEVSGTCENVIAEARHVPFRINGFKTQLRIQGVPPFANLNQTAVTCGVEPTGTPPNRVLRITESSNVRLTGLNINGGNGVLVDDSDVTFDSVVVEGGNVLVRGEAGSRFRLNNGSQVNNSCSHGILVDRGSFGSARDAVIEGNTGFGLLTFDGGRVTANGTTMVLRNVQGGMFVGFGGTGTVAGAAEIRENGANSDPSSFLFPFRSGVVAQFGSILFVGGPRDPATGLPEGPRPRIDDNFGPGILLDLNSTARVRIMTASGNDGGLIVTHESAVELQEAVTLSGNGFADLDCDQSSLAFGDLTGVGNNRCQGTPEPGGQGQGQGRGGN